MTHLPPPPPASRKTMIVAAAFLGALAVVAMLLIGDEIGNPIYHDITRLQPQPSTQEQERFTEQKDHLRQEILNDVKDPALQKTLQQRVDAAPDEVFELSLQSWRNLHILLPVAGLLALILLALYWRKRRRNKH